MDFANGGTSYHKKPNCAVDRANYWPGPEISRSNLKLGGSQNRSYCETYTDSERRCQNRIADYKISQGPTDKCYDGKDR